MKREFSRLFFSENSSHIKFHEIPSIASRVVHSDRNVEANGRF